MAFVANFRCVTCGQEKEEVVHDQGRVCRSCRREKEIADRDSHLKKLKEMPLEDRVARIEEMLYDLDLENRLKRLDNLTARF